MNMSTADVYKMLTIIDKNADNLAKLDGDFNQIAGGKLAAFQSRSAGADLEPDPHSSGPGEIPEGKGQVGSEVGFQSRHDVIEVRRD